MKKLISALAFGLVFISATGLAIANGPDDVGGVAVGSSGGVTGNLVFVSDGFDGTEPTQDGRIFRDGVASTCAVPKTYPGLFNGGIQHQYKTYTMFNGSSTCVTVNFDPNPGSGNDCGVDAHLSAYLGSYDPANQSANYLADVGSSLTQPFSFNVPTGATVILVASINSGSNVVCNLEFSSDELSADSPFSTIGVPSMNAWGLGVMALVLGLAGFLARRRKMI